MHDTSYQSPELYDVIATEYHPLTQPVGQLVEVDQYNQIKQRFCTGFSVTEGGLFLTAGLCKILHDRL